MLFTEKYKPKSLEEMFLTPSMENTLKGLMKSPTNFTLCGSAGLGKSTFLDIYVKYFNGLRYHFKLEDDRGVDSLNAIKNFYHKNSYGGKRPMFVTIDEVDSMSVKALDVLKNVGDDYVGKVYFIMTTNKPEKLPEPFLSRFPRVDFDYKLSTKEDTNHILKAIGTKLKGILEQNGIEVCDELKLVLRNFILRHYPDIRKLMMAFQNVINDFKASGNLDFAKYMSFGNNSSLWEHLIILLKSPEGDKYMKFIRYYKDNALEGSKIQSFILDIYDNLINNDLNDNKLRINLTHEEVVSETITNFYQVQNSYVGQHIFLFNMISTMFVIQNRKV